jgi:hypothetical protein
MSARTIASRLLLPGFAALCLLATVWAGYAQTGNAGRPISLIVHTAVALRSTQFAIADFDGDRRPDLARVRVTRDGSPTSEYSLDFNFSSGAKTAIGIVGPSGGLQITPRDVNGDKFADLVVTSLLDSHFVAIFLNDGKGNFIAAKPSEFPGAVKGTDIRLRAPEDVPGARVALLSGRDSAGYGGVAAPRQGPLGVFSVATAGAAASVLGETIFPSAGRAPPRV